MQQSEFWLFGEALSNTSVFGDCSWEHLVGLPWEVNEKAEWDHYAQEWKGVPLEPKAFSLLDREVRMCGLGIASDLEKGGSLQRAGMFSFKFWLNMSTLKSVLELERPSSSSQEEDVKAVTVLK